MRLKQLPFFSNVGAEFFNAETEGDILYAQKLAWEDPNNEMQSWDPTLFNPRTWFHMTCNDDNSDIHVQALFNLLVPCYMFFWVQPFCSMYDKIKIFCLLKKPIFVVRS